MPRAASRGSTLRDSAVAVGVVALLFGGLYLYSGTWPPLVIIESGSMMHPEDQVPYGRIGTIDPGDIVFVKSVHSRADIATWAEGGPLRYGKSGDVIIYYRANDSRSTPVIHRAMAWVEVASGRGGAEYRVDWLDGQTLAFGPAGIYLPELGFDEGAGFSPQSGYRPLISGFITKGDNPLTNSRADQAGGISDQPVPIDWIAGTAHGEIPWFGLPKLALATQTNPPNDRWVRVGNAFAPLDLWVMLGISIAFILLVPLVWDVIRAWRAKREVERDWEMARDRGKKGKEKPAKPKPATREVREFTPIERT
ncbi:MAG: S26 family signal peptidase [Thermoplasmatota archaeon]